MKKLLLSLTVVAFSAVAAGATEPLLLEPLSPAVLNQAGISQTTTYTDENGVQVTVPNGLDATYVPVSDTNMVPQNAAAEGKPVPKKRLPRIRIITKQGRQSNTQWKPGGKGTKSFF